MQKLVYSLHRADRHEHVIAVIEGALANSQSQPWMYDVLALSMEIVDRPQEDIDRVLLSRVDFTTTDVPNMLYSAAFLVRLGGRKQALHLYRQASRIDATRPEPYILGLKLARELKSTDAVEWATTGILTHAWTRDREKRHLEARDAVADTVRELRDGRQNEEADRLEKSLAIASQRDLIVRLDWSGDGNLDFDIEEPFGTVCSALNPLSAGGGVMVHNGYGPKPENSYDEYICVKGGAGDYRIRIHHVSGNIVGKRCQLTITRYLGTEDELVRKLSVPLDKATKVVRISLHQGRRERIGPEPSREVTPASSRQASRRSIIAGLSRLIPWSGRGNAGAGAAANQGAGRAAGGGGLPAGAFNQGVGFTPVIGLIREGVSLSTTAIVSPDRRYVRLAVAPMFNALLGVETFSFVGGGGGGGQAQGGGQGQGQPGGAGGGGN